MTVETLAGPGGMNSPVSAVQAGRIRDAARVTWAAGIVAIVTFFVSFIVDQAIFGFGLWPIGFLLLALACAPLFRGAGTAAVVLVTLVAVVGAVLEIAGLLFPPPGTQFRIGIVFGAGTVAVGAWFVGAGAILREVGGFTPDVPMRTIRGGLGLAIVGASWFIEDLALSLGIILVGAWLSGGITPFLSQARRFGLPAPAAVAPVATEEAPAP